MPERFSSHWYRAIPRPVPVLAFILGVGFCALWFAAASAAVTEDMRREKRVALVIGNAAYAESPRAQSRQ